MHEHLLICLIILDLYIIKWSILNLLPYYEIRMMSGKNFITSVGK